MGWDMDPFVVCSFGKKVFRTRVIRHSLNPVFEEKLLFQVRSYETSFRVQLSVHDWDKLSSNDHIGDTGFEVSLECIFRFRDVDRSHMKVSEIIGKAPQKDQGTGLYAESEDGSHDMVEYRLKLEVKDGSLGAKQRPVVYIRSVWTLATHGIHTNSLI